MVSEVLIASYNRDKACKGQEDKVVNNIVKSLTKILKQEAITARALEFNAVYH
jgi:hypothetical protein